MYKSKKYYVQMPVGACKYVSVRIYLQQKHIKHFIRSDKGTE